MPSKRALSMDSRGLRNFLSGRNSQIGDSVESDKGSDKTWDFV